MKTISKAKKNVIIMFYFIETLMTNLKVREDTN